MTEVLRPSLYGAQHPIVALTETETVAADEEEADYVVVGHCCESVRSRESLDSFFVNLLIST